LDLKQKHPFTKQLLDIAIENEMISEFNFPSTVNISLTISWIPCLEAALPMYLNLIMPGIIDEILPMKPVEPIMRADLVSGENL
jgi:hypothetical protein